METLAATAADNDDEEQSEEQFEESVDISADKEETETVDQVGVVDTASPPEDGGDTAAFRAAGALMFPGLDRGRTLWGEDNYQSALLQKTVPVPLGGFYVNGVVGEGRSIAIVYAWS